MNYIIKVGLLLVVMAMVSLFFGAKAGQVAAVAGAGYAKNLRHDIFIRSRIFPLEILITFLRPVW